MDNKITKKRLSAFLHYEWIKIIALALCACFLFRFVFVQLGASSRLLENGQVFYFHYEAGISDACRVNTDRFLKEEGVLSYEVLETSVGELDMGTYADQLSAWSAAGDVDVILCTNISNGEDTPHQTFFKNMVDMIAVLDFDTVYANAFNYAKGFLVDGETELKKDKISDAKVEKSFGERSFKDNRFKNSSDREEGVKLEKRRIEILFDSVNDLGRLLTQHPEIFIEYTKYETTYIQAQIDDNLSKSLEDKYRQEMPKKYGVDLSKLVFTEGKQSITDFAVIEGQTDATGIVFAMFNVDKFQPTLCYEGISVLTKMVRATTNFLD